MVLAEDFHQVRLVSLATTLRLVVRPAPMVNVILTKDFHQVQLLAEVKEFTVATAMVLLLAQCFLWRPLRPQRPLRLLLLLRRVLLLRRMFSMLLDLLLLLLLLNTLGLINSFANQLLVKLLTLRRSSWLSNNS